jgi:hypothetical protein
MERNVLQVFSRNVFGVKRIYPANAVARVAAQLVGVQTFNKDQLGLLGVLGFQVEQVVDPASVIGVVA